MRYNTTCKKVQEAGLQNTNDRDARPKDPYLRAVGSQSVVSHGLLSRTIRYFGILVAYSDGADDSIQDVLHGCDVKEGAHFASKLPPAQAWRNNGGNGGGERS